MAAEGRIIGRGSRGDIEILAFDQMGQTSEDVFLKTATPTATIEGNMASDPRNPLGQTPFHSDNLDFHRHPERAKAFADLYNRFT